MKTMAFTVIDPDYATAPIKDFVHGELRFNEGGGTIIITRRLIRGSTSEQPRTIAAGLAYGNRFSNDWHQRTKGAAVSLGRISSSAADTLTDTLTLAFPATKRVALNQHWLFFEVWGDIRPPGGSWVKAFKSFHSAPDFFQNASP